MTRLASQQLAVSGLKWHAMDVYAEQFESKAIANPIPLVAAIQHIHMYIHTYIYRYVTTSLCNLFFDDANVKHILPNVKNNSDSRTVRQIFANTSFPTSNNGLSMINLNDHMYF